MTAGAKDWHCGCRSYPTRGPGVLCDYHAGYWDGMERRDALPYEMDGLTRERLIAEINANRDSIEWTVKNG